MPHDTIRDDPLTGKDNAKSVWFGTGKVDGKPAALLVTATRDLSNIKTLYDPVFANIDIYRLELQSGFGTSYIFMPVHHSKTVKKYVNTECALADELHVPVRVEYAGNAVWARPEIDITGRFPYDLSMEIEPTPDQAAFIADAMKAGRIAAPEDAARLGLKLWEEHERRRLKLLFELQIGIDEIARGEFTTYDSASSKMLAEEVDRRGRERLLRELKDDPKA